MATKQNDFVKVNKISEKLTGTQFGIRHTSKKFRDVIQQCNDAVQGVINKEQIKVSKALTPVTTEKQVIELINAQNLTELEKLETFSKMELEAFEMLKLYFKSRKQAYSELREKACEFDGKERIDFEVEIFKVSALVNVTHTFSSGDRITPESNDIDVNILEFSMTYLQ